MLDRIKPRRINRADNPHEYWVLDEAEVIYGPGYYTYSSNPPDDQESIKKYGYELPASAMLSHALESTDECYITITEWKIRGTYLPLTQSNVQGVLLQVLAAGTKKVRTELNGCI